MVAVLGQTRGEEKSRVEFGKGEVKVGGGRGGVRGKLWTKGILGAEA